MAISLAVSPLAVHATGDFYEQPLQTLPDYLKLDQLPAKSIDDIVAESAKREPKAPEINFAAELLDLAKKPGREALASVDKMIAAARTKAATPLLNLLNDIHDVLAGPATAAETASYLQWRIEKADQFGVMLDKGKAADAPNNPPPQPDAALGKEIEEAVGKASPALRPHWLYLSGAVDFLTHNIDGAQTTFTEVAKEYPKSPRAEVALFMAARCAVYKARNSEYTQQDMKLNASDRPAAKKLFDEYFAKYPHGRFLGDVLGWYGAYAFDGHDFGTALRCYLQQLEMTDHPDIAPMAAEMVMKTLSHIASDPKDKYFAEVAKYPKGAQALVYLVINTSESDNYNGKLDSIDEVRGWRKKVLPKIGAAISAQAKLYQNAEWKPRYLAMLAYAASGAGQHEQAIKLLETAGNAAQESDDLLMARGVVFHRAKRPGEAAKALQTLLDKFPDSPLAKGARLRLGLALADDHRGGEAVLALRKLLPEKKDAAEKKPDAPDATPPSNPEVVEEDQAEDESTGDRILYGIDINQIRALIDTLLNFAPEGELVAVSQTAGLDPVLRLMFTEAVAERYLAKEQFDEAKKYMTPAQYGLLAASLEKLTLAAREAKEPAAKVAACMKLGDAWADARGKLLTYPLDTDERRREIYIDYFAEANVRRADSAPFIGATGSYKLDLENRDELRHAFNWWLEASDAQPGSPQTAQALWKALKAMPQIADVSPFTYERAVTRKWAEVARKLHDRLRKECPDSVEAKRYAAVWSFDAPKKKPEDQDYVTHRSKAGTGISGAEALGFVDEGGEYGKGIEALNAEINDLQNLAGTRDPSFLKSKADILCSEARRAHTGLYSARWVNLVDDLALFFSEPDPGPDVRKRYAELRFRFFNKSAIGGSGYDEDRDNAADETLQKDIGTALADPATKPVADYFEFLNLAVTANHFVFVDLKAKDKKSDEKKADEKKDAGIPEDNTSKDEDSYRTRDYPTMVKEAEAFLAKYPKSKKREAAMLLHARAVYRSSEEVELPKTVSWPQASRWEGGYDNTRTQQAPFDAKRVLAALDAYDQAFPHGRYSADIRSYRAAVALRQHEWKTAVDLTVAQLEDHADPSLDMDTADRLSEVFDQLVDERYRLDILAAIKGSPHAREFLAKYLDVDSDAHPLLYLKSWLREQLAAK